LVYLAAALDGGVDRPAVRFLLARGLADIEQTFTELLGNGEPVTAVRFLRRGPRAVVGDRRGWLRIYDVPSARKLRVIPAHHGAITALWVDDAGGRLITAGADGLIRLWDSESYELVAELAGHRGPVTALRLAAD